MGEYEYYRKPTLIFFGGGTAQILATVLTLFSPLVDSAPSSTTLLLSNTFSRPVSPLKCSNRRVGIKFFVDQNSSQLAHFKQRRCTSIESASRRMEKLNDDSILYMCEFLFLTDLVSFSMTNQRYKM